MLLSHEFSINQSSNLNLLHLKQTYLCRELLPLDTKYIWRIEEGIVRTYTRNQNQQLMTLGFWGEGDIPLKQYQSPIEMLCDEQSDLS